MRELGKAVVWFKDVTKNDIPLVGGKGANLGEMTGAGIPVPQGFIVTADAYFYFIENAGIDGVIADKLEGLDIHNSLRLQKVADEIQEIIRTADIPAVIADEIEKAYKEMGRGLVAVRSSATAEDLPEASFAGQQATFLNILGDKNVVNAVRDCWASLFGARAIFYRHEQGFEHFKVGIAVPVQHMVQSEASGVMFTVDPMNGNRDVIVIEAVIGLGEMIVSGDVTPDHYAVNKADLTILKKEIKKQEWKLVKQPDSADNVKVVLTPAEQEAQKITDDDIARIAAIGKRLEDHYQFPQDVEWAREQGRIYIVQTRPVTTMQDHVVTADEIDEPVLLSGSPASPGVASGPVKLIKDASEIDRVMEGDVLVAEMTTPDFVPAMKRAAAIVTERGGRTAHAAIVSRELGIPCVVGAGEATLLLKDGQKITVDGSHGRVYNGVIKVASEVKKTHEGRIETKTKLLVNLAQPDLADQVASKDVDGIGLLRAEFMIARIGEHPGSMIDQGRGGEFVDKLAENLTIFARAFHPRRVVYRTNDLKSNEYRALKGGEKYEDVEENPMIGYRGASRYITDVATFKLELEAIKRVRQTYNNLWVMIPFVRTVDELKRTIDIIHTEGLQQSDDFKIWMMAEIPSNVILLEKFLETGVDGVSIGSNDLTQLTLGVDRDSSKLVDTFNERDEAVMMSLERIVKVTKQMGVTCSICGQAPSFYPDLTEKLVEWGITSVSVSPDMIDTTREIIAAVEKKLGIT